MQEFHDTKTSLFISAIALCMMATSVSASDLGGGYKDPVESDGRKLELSANAALTSDYVFRGFSQSGEHAAIQGGFDASYGILYTGIWGSSLDFGGGPLSCPGTGDCADIEVDLYAGIKPKLGPLELDLGVIYYAYPDASDAGTELDFWEFKAGASFNPIEPLSISGTVYYSPDFTLETGEVVTVEGAAELSLPDFGPLSPALSSTIGSVHGGNQFAVNGDNEYQYWNAGLAVGFAEKFSLDMRYWDTNVSNTGNFCKGEIFQCDARFVATLSASF